MKPYKLITFFIYFLFSFSSYAQSEDSDLLNSRIVLSVVMPQNEEKINHSNFAKIRSKIKQIISKNDVAATDYYSDFVIYPSVEVYDEETIDAGLQPIAIINGDFSLFVKQISTNKLFGSITVGFKGSGNSKSKAITKGISKLNSNHPKFQAFIKNVKGKIITYYQKNCSHFISEADKLNRSNRNEEALVSLLSIPSGTTSCNSQIKNKVIQYYKDYSNQICEEKMQLAKGYSSEQNYANALSILRNIDPNSKCRNASLQLMKSMESKINKKDKQLYDLTLKMYTNEMNLEKARIESIKEVAKNYNKNHLSTNDTKLYIVK